MGIHLGKQGVGISFKNVAKGTLHTLKNDSELQRVLFMCVITHIQSLDIKTLKYFSNSLKHSKSTVDVSYTVL